MGDITATIVLGATTLHSGAISLSCATNYWQHHGNYHYVPTRNRVYDANYLGRLERAPANLSSSSGHDVTAVQCQLLSD